MTHTKKTCCYKTPPNVYGKEEPCQFMNEPGMEDRLVQVGGRWFCAYHLPFSSENLKEGYGAEEQVDHEAFKKTWSEAKISELNTDVHNRLMEALESGKLCNLTGTVFPGSISFMDKRMPTVLFSHCHFAGYSISFKGANFTDDCSVSFDCAQFSCMETDFSGVQFRDEVDFSNARFSGAEVNFKNARFSGVEVHFVGTEFSAEVDFSGAHFTSINNDFSYARFAGMMTDFNGTQFAGRMTNFSGARFTGRYINFSPKSQSEADAVCQNIYFDKAFFKHPVKFANRVFLDTTSFRGAVFTRAPSFHGCTLHQDTRFPPIENFKDTKSDYAAHAYRTLRLAMKEQEAHEEEAMFWALEQRSKRNNLDLRKPKNWFPWALSWGYDVLSNYGLNAGLPARWLGGWIIYSTVIYACVAGSLERLASLDHWLGALGFSIAQMARPFFIWGDYDGTDIKAALGSDEFSFLIKMLATVDSIVSLTLIALFILAVRRRFRMQ